MVLIGPSLMCADQGILRDSVETLDDCGVDYFHFDVMDGVFVPNYSLSADTVKDLRKYTKKPFDVHLMVQNPERYIDQFVDAGADLISIHAESTNHLHRAIDRIHARGARAGVAINPATSLHVLDYVLEMTHYVCLMTVNPGFSGQTFISGMYEKVEELKAKIDREKTDTQIQVDGNIGLNTISKIVPLGATMLVCGTSCLFQANSDLSSSAIKLRVFVQEQIRLNNERM